MSAMYAVYHGPQRLTEIARGVHKSTAYLAMREWHGHKVSMLIFLLSDLRNAGHEIVHKDYFDTLKVRLKNGEAMEELKKRAEEMKMNFRYYENGDVGVSLDETVKSEDLMDIIYTFNGATEKDVVSWIGVQNTDNILFSPDEAPWRALGSSLSSDRKLPAFEIFPLPPASSFQHLSQWTAARALYEETREQGCFSCSFNDSTWKLHHEAECLCRTHCNDCVQYLEPSIFQPITWPSLSSIHPFVPAEQAKGYKQIFGDLEKWLCEITGYDNFSLQPNSGANGEYAGLLAIRNYLIHKGQEQRNVSSEFHVSVSNMFSDLSDSHLCPRYQPCLCSSRQHEGRRRRLGSSRKHQLQRSCSKGGEVLESTGGHHGHLPIDSRSLRVLDPRCLWQSSRAWRSSVPGRSQYECPSGSVQTRRLRKWRVASESPQDILHSSRRRWSRSRTNRSQEASRSVPARPLRRSCWWPSCRFRCCCSVRLCEHPGYHLGVYPNDGSNWNERSHPSCYSQRKLYGEETRERVQNCVQRLVSTRSLLENGDFSDEQGLVAHEFIMDCKPFKKHGIEVVDIAKRLMDYGFHSPTMSWPVHDCLMIEPTESGKRDGQIT